MMFLFLLAAIMLLSPAIITIFLLIIQFIMMIKEDTNRKK